MDLLVSLSKLQEVKCFDFKRQIVATELSTQTGLASSSHALPLRSDHFVVSPHVIHSFLCTLFSLGPSIWAKFSTYQLGEDAFSPYQVI